MSASWNDRTYYKCEQDIINSFGLLSSRSHCAANVHTSAHPPTSTPILAPSILRCMHPFHQPPILWTLFQTSNPPTQSRIVGSIHQQHNTTRPQTKRDSQHKGQAQQETQQTTQQWRLLCKFPLCIVRSKLAESNPCVHSADIIPDVFNVANACYVLLQSLFPV